MNITVGSSSGKKWGFSHQSGNDRIQEAFPQTGLCSSWVQDITSAPSEFIFHVRPPEREVCRSKQGNTRWGRLRFGMLHVEKSHPQRKEAARGSKWLWERGLVYSLFLYIVNSIFLILKVISLYFRIFRKYWLKKAQNKNHRQFLKMFS